MSDMIRQLRKDKRGVTAVVTFVLLMSVALIFIGNWLNTAIPKWGNADELDHIMEVQNQFVSIRATVNALADSDQTGFLIPNTVTLGTPGEAFKGVARANGDLTFDPLESSIILNQTSPATTLIATKGNLRFNSYNAYYPDQSVVFESGAIIRYQSGNSVMIAPPQFSAGVVDNDTTVSMAFISLTGSKDIASGNIDMVVYAQLMSTEENNFNWESSPKDVKIVVNTGFSGAWLLYCQTTMQKAGFRDTSPASPTLDREFSVATGQNNCTLSLAKVDYFNSKVIETDISIV
jgi:hypothetical protein